MRKILPKKFFSRPAPLVAQELLGKYVVRKIGTEEIALKITETEAYEGFEDRASHAYRGKTTRNSVMFGEAGILYIYFVYGMHHMLNIVTGKKDFPSAVLIRGAESVVGPGRLAKFLSINRGLTHLPATPATGLWFEDRGEEVDSKKIKLTPRIGVDYAGEKWAKKLYRFVLEKD